MHNAQQQGSHKELVHQQGIYADFIGVPKKQLAGSREVQEIERGAYSEKI